MPQHVVTIEDMMGKLGGLHVSALRPPQHTLQHMTAVENATDDGTLDAFPSNDDETDEDEAEPEEYDCDGFGDFSCWPCVRTGRTELSN